MTGVGSARMAAIRWDPAAGDCLSVLTGDARVVSGVACRRDGRLLATASHDRTARVWDRGRGTSEQRLALRMILVSGVPVVLAEKTTNIADLRGCCLDR